MSSSPILGNSELAQLLAPTGNPYPRTTHSAGEAYTKIKAEDEEDYDDRNDYDHAENHEETAYSGYPREMSFESTNDIKNEYSNDHNGDYNNDNQPPAATNGTYSESLSRLQNGFLHAISVLEDRNKALQNEVNDLRSRQSSINQPMARRLASVEQRNDKLEAELRAARMWPYTHKETLRNLELTLAKKNQTIKEKNSKINDMEARDRALEQELNSERKKSRRLGTTIEMQNRPHVASWRGNETSGGTTTLAIRERRDMVKAEDSTTYPAMKKRKHEESTDGGRDNPVMLD